MRHLRKPLMIGLVWLTAAMTAVAGTPYLLCHCANGAIQLPGLFSSSQACCARKVAQHTASKPRCPHCSPPAVNPDSSQLSSPGCHWTTAQPVAFCGQDSRPVLHHDGATGVLLAVDILGLTSAHLNAVRAVHEPDQQPPPTNRVIALQRFLI